MTIAAILRHKGREAVTLAPTTTAAEVVQVLSEKGIGAVLVVDQANRLLGIISERDIVRSLHANGARTLEMTANDLMTRSLYTASPKTTINEAMRQMTARRFRHVPILEDGELAGLVSIGDVVKAVIMQQGEEVDSLKAYIAGSA